MRNILILTVLAALAFTSNAQIQEEKPFIEITGTSEIKISPNQIFIHINIKENIDRSKKSIDEREQDLIKALQSSGISPSKLVVKDANSYYGKTGLIGREVISSRQYELEVKDAPQAKKAFEQLDKLNIKNANIVRVDHSEMEDYKRQAKIKAIKAAKVKANYLLEAVGEDLGGALIVRENSVNVMGNNYRRNARELYAYGRFESGGAAEVDLDFKKITITASIYTKWRIGK
ncbi:MAG: hypothetical protein COA58_02575 [Bacteroidetes bacterium]|nr:MAG: hypothetical protein COA58_02575 [Bacteroidota bacterium]